MAARTDAISSSRRTCSATRAAAASQRASTTAGVDTQLSSSRHGQPLGVPAHDDDFDGAACCQQRRPTTRHTARSRFAGGLCVSSGWTKHERRPVGIERQQQPVDEVPAAGSVRVGVHPARPHVLRHTCGREHRRLRPMTRPCSARSGGLPGRFCEREPMELIVSETADFRSSRARASRPARQSSGAAFDAGAVARLARSRPTEPETGRRSGSDGQFQTLGAGVLPGWRPDHLPDAATAGESILAPRRGRSSGTRRERSSTA